MSTALIPGSEEVSGAAAPSRRRSWQTLIVVALIAAIYVAAWLCYTARYSSRIDRYHELPAGAVYHGDEADYRSIGLVQSPYVVDESKGLVTSATGTVWVVSTVEATLRAPNEDFYCDSFDLLGAQNRRFEAASSPAYRPSKQSPCGPEDVQVGVPYRYEVIYSVPLGQVDGIVGLTLESFYAGQVSPVLRPPAS